MNSSIKTTQKTQVEGGPRRISRNADAIRFFVFQESFLDREQPPAGITDYTQVGAHVRMQSKGVLFTGAFEVSGMLATNVEKYTMFEMPEAYMGMGHRPIVTDEAQSSSDGGHLRTVIGRKKERWSALDSEWDLGLWQPLNRFDYIHPSEQGLAGTFVAWGAGKADVMLFASPLFIPEQGPSFEVQDGAVRSNSPWFSEPADSTILFSKNTRVNYEIEIPSVGSVVNHPSGGIMLRYGSDREEGLLARAAWMKKPRNQLSLPFEGYLDISGSPAVARVHVRPQIAYHNLTSLDLGYRSRNWALGVSGLSDISDEEEVEDTYTYQRLHPMVMVSPHAEARLLPSASWGPRLRLAYLHTFGGEASTVGPYASSQGIFAPRTMLRQAVSLSARSIVVRGARWRLENQLKWIEEIEEQGTIVSGELQLTMDETWRAELAADLLGSRQAADETRTFIARYRGNDRFAARLTYFF